MEITVGNNIFEFFVKEFQEETGLDTDFVGSMSGIGVFVMPTTRIGVVLDVQLSVNKVQFQRLAKPNFEHERFVCLTKEEITGGRFYTDKSLVSTLQYIR